MTWTHWGLRRLWTGQYQFLAPAPYVGRVDLQIPLRNSF